MHGVLELGNGNNSAISAVNFSPLSFPELAIEEIAHSGGSKSSNSVYNVAQRESGLQLRKELEFRDNFEHSRLNVLFFELQLIWNLPKTGTLLQKISFSDFQLQVELPDCSSHLLSLSTKFLFTFHST